MVGPFLTEDLSSLPLTVILNGGGAIPRGCFGKYVETHAVVTSLDKVVSKKILYIRQCENNLAQ